MNKIEIALNDEQLDIINEQAKANNISLGAQIAATLTIGAEEIYTDHVVVRDHSDKVISIDIRV